MNTSFFNRLFKRNPPQTHGLIPEKKQEDTGLFKIFGTKNGSATATIEYVSPIKYCDPDVADARKITGVRQYHEPPKEATYIEILHNNKARLLHGGTPPTKESEESESPDECNYDRPYFGSRYHWKKREKEEKQKRKLFKELPSRF